MDADVPTNDTVVKALRRARDIACWALLGMMLVCGLANQFFPIGIGGAVLMVAFIFAAMGTSLAVVVAVFLRPPRASR